VAVVPFAVYEKGHHFVGGKWFVTCVFEAGLEGAVHTEQAHTPHLV
jgi:hypothetical protein